MTKILVIEDEANIRDEVMRWLSLEDFDVVGAANGSKGLGTAIRELPDLILCDIAMPEMDGYEVLMEIRSNPHLNHIPFIFLTAAVDRTAMRKGMDLGADDYITKPFTHAELFSCIRTRLQKQARQVVHTQTQLYELSEALKEEHEKRVLGLQFMTMLSHDSRNALSAILSSAQMLRDYANRMDEERKRAKLDRIITSAGQIAQMLSDVMLAADLESNHLEYLPEVIDFTALVEGIVEEFRVIHSETHVLTYSASVRSLAALDPKLMRHVIMNLISNAIKYSSQGSEVCVKIAETSDFIELRVQDNGIGIPAEELPFIFNSFYRAKNAKHITGTGLGLSIVKEAIKHCAGKVDVESEVGTGTTFTIQIPKIHNN